MTKKKTFVSERRACHRRLKTAIVRDVRKGSHGAEAARRHGLSEGTFWRWQYTDPTFQARLRSAREEGIRRIKRAVLAKLRAGKTLKDTAKIVGRTPGTLRAWRRKDPAFDGEVTALVREQRKRRMQQRAKRTMKP